MGCSSRAYGGRPLASSMAVMPIDHISAQPSYRDCVITSGAIQKGVPTRVLRLSMLSVSWPVTPKSPNRTLASLR